MILQITQVGLIILIPPSKESKLDFLINHLLPQDKTSLDSPLVISFSTFILSNRCVSLGCSKDWKNWSVKSYHFPWFVTSMTCPYVWQYENWKIGPNWGPSWIAWIFLPKIFKNVLVYPKLTQKYVLWHLKWEKKQFFHFTTMLWLNWILNFSRKTMCFWIKRLPLMLLDFEIHEFLSTVSAWRQSVGGLVLFGCSSRYVR